MERISGLAWTVDQGWRAGYRPCPLRHDVTLQCTAGVVACICGATRQGRVTAQGQAQKQLARAASQVSGFFVADGLAGVWKHQPRRSKTPQPPTATLASTYCAAPPSWRMKPHTPRRQTQTDMI
ncbi:hypothetical protein GGTG_08788 [Gaeumannomyces tritici R3-111a-1]|uniref:Uncharacterized protein n=1 Tax=Gaeumannomyces tritici (strain R3-111a-1) TaxID=644352 RepID=J3P5J9_GAET3|nr:hypothetical protein GGTG_08788 [Gaeumannomyces tritici R3-111a-1]EJT74950.1 hypothetical protein GGTG_08788 [Gaeumannomyces tritici R3-111a-1]